MYDLDVIKTTLEFKTIKESDLVNLRVLYLSKYFYLYVELKTLNN